MNKRKKVSIFGGKAADFLLDGMRAEDTASVGAAGKTLVVPELPFASVIAREIVRANPDRIILTGGRSPGFDHFIEGRGIHLIERANWKALGIECAYDAGHERMIPESNKISRLLPSGMRARTAWTESNSQSLYENLLAVRKSGAELKRVVLLTHELHALRAVLTARHLLRHSEVEVKTYRLAAMNGLYQKVMAGSEFHNLKKYGAKWDRVRDVLTGEIPPPDAAVKTAMNFLMSAEYDFQDDARRAAFDKFGGRRPFLETDIAGDFLASVDALSPRMRFADQEYLLNGKINPESAGEYDRLSAAMAILSGGFELDLATRRRLAKTR